MIKKHRQSVLLLGIFYMFIGCVQAAAPSLTAPEALDKLRAGELTLIDVRTPSEWRQTGVAPHALRIDMHDPNGVDGFAEKVLTAVHGDQSAPIAVICRTGNRSSYTQQELMSRGFSHVFNIPEGMVGTKAGSGWIGHGLPVEPCPDC